MLPFKGGLSLDVEAPLAMLSEAITAVMIIPSRKMVVPEWNMFLVDGNISYKFELDILVPGCTTEMGTTKILESLLYSVCKSFQLVRMLLVHLNAWQVLWHGLEFNVNILN